MPLSRHRPNLIKLAGQLEQIERSIQEAERDSAYLPSPHEMKALAYIRIKLPRLTDKCSTLEPVLWQRIRKWQETPYTPRQQAMRSIAAFIGWWMAGTVALSFTVMGWFVSFFPEAWYSFAASAAITLVITLFFVIKKAGKGQ